MPCLDLETLLRYVHQDTNQDATEEIRRHMEQCSTCYHALETLHELSSNLTQLAPDPAECLDATLLAAYVDQRLMLSERTHVEQHVRRCQRCSDEVQAAEQVLSTTLVMRQTAPASLLARASALGSTSHTPAPARWQTRRQQLQAWAESLVPRPQWGWAFSGAAAAVILAVLVARAPWQTPTGSVVQTTPEQRTYGYGFGTADDVLVAGRVPLSPALREALTAYQAQPAAETRAPLLALLNAASVAVQESQVAAIELKPSVQALAEPGQAASAAVQVTLFKDGLLVIGEAL